MSAEQIIHDVSPNYSGGKRVPWWGKLGVKLVLARIPFAYTVWSKLGIFAHSNKKSGYGRVYEGFIKHLKAYQEINGALPETFLELGPGDSVGRAVSAASVGAKKMWLVDVGDFATRDDAHYKNLFSYALEKGGHFEGMPQDYARDSVLDFCHAEYKTDGLAGLKDIPADTVQFSFSDAVLEHVRHGEFAQTMKELYRVTTPGGVHRHWVDLHDHLGGRLNNLRFPAGFWESDLVARSGFYTNRLSMQEIVSMAEAAGFKVTIPVISKWPAVPTPREKMHNDFKSRSNDELCVCTFLMVMRK
ncbi:MAG: methyltransferase [Alphaproteobacteria bacterium CG_4_9_14_3_um_filter_47_13]|nr:MAG: methyltransferase [Alphaproteobacteria bacterium CG_4_9_14_3_um_filter_47_13]